MRLRTGNTWWKWRLPVLVFVGIAANSHPAHADPLVLVATDPNSVVAIDLGEKQETGLGTIRVWQIERYGTPSITIKGKAAKVIKTQYEVRCSTKETRRLYAFAFDSSGGSIDYGPFRESWMPSPPGSYYIDLHRVACGGPSATDVIFDDMDHLAKTQDAIAREKGH